MKAITSQSQFETLRENTEIYWVGIDGKVNGGIFTRCYCGQPRHTNGMTIHSMPKSMQDKLINAEKIDLPEFDGDVETETCTC